MDNQLDNLIIDQGENIRKDDKADAAYKLVWILCVINLFTYGIRSFLKNHDRKLKFLIKL